MVMSRNASMTTTLELLRPMVPPALPRTAFFSERDLASKIGNSTHALCVWIWGWCGSDTAYRYCPVPWPCWPDLPTPGGSAPGAFVAAARAAIC